MMIITTVIMFFTALLLFLIMTGGLWSFYNTLTRTTGESACINEKNSFCELNPNSKWSASSMRYYNKTCEKLIGEISYNCREKRWEGCAFWCKELQRYSIKEDDSKLTKRAVNLFTSVCIHGERCKKTPECSNINFKRCEGTAETLLR